MTSAKQITIEEAFPFLATLRRARTYWLKDTVFEKGVQVPITEDQKLHLEEHACEDRLRYVDDQTGEPEIERIGYFEFIPNTPATAGATS